MVCGPAGTFIRSTFGFSVWATITPTIANTPTTANAHQLRRLPDAAFDAASILQIYRLRWQIELVFKRMKSIMGLGQLPKKDSASSRAWLHGKLFVALLVERVVEAAKSFSPWGYPLEVSAESVEGNRIHVP
jgi:Transposase DDE domain